MENTVKIMDLDINMISGDAFILKTKEYLTDDHLNVILLATTKMLEEATEDNEYKEMLSKADLILPGEEALLSMHHAEDLEVGGMIINYRCLEQLIESVDLKKHTFYAVAGNEDELERFSKYCRKNYLNVDMVGSYIMKAGQNDEAMINEINAVAPDILILILASPMQEKWIMSAYTKLNSKLCICAGGVMEKVLEEYKEPPLFIRFLGMEKVYFNYRTKMKKVFQVRIFKRKVANYKNKKGE